MNEDQVTLQRGMELSDDVAVAIGQLFEERVASSSHATVVSVDLRLEVSHTAGGLTSLRLLLSGLLRLSCLPKKGSFPMPC